MVKRFILIELEDTMSHIPFNHEGYEDTVAIENAIEELYDVKVTRIRFINNPTGNESILDYFDNESNHNRK